MPTQKSKRNQRSTSSGPNGWHTANYSAQIHLTVKQQRYCERETQAGTGLAIQQLRRHTQPE